MRGKIRFLLFFEAFFKLFFLFFFSFSRWSPHIEHFLHFSASNFILCTKKNNKKPMARKTY